MKPNPNDPQHVTLAMLQNFYSLGMQRDQEIAKCREQGHRLGGELADSRRARQTIDRMVDTLQKIANTEHLQARAAKQIAREAIRSLEDDRQLLRDLRSVFTDDKTKDTLF